MSEVDDVTAAYRQAFVDLLPEGPAWSAFSMPGTAATALRDAKVAGFVAVHTHFTRLLDELLPWRARQTLSSRETEAGLPDTCTAGRVTTFIDRQAAVSARWAGCVYPHTAAGFTALAASIGYSVTVDLAPPFRVGISRCGVDALNPNAAAFTLRVTVHGPRKTRFRAGVSQAGSDPLTKVQAAEDLECMIRRRAHSHITVIFIYEGE